MTSSTANPNRYPEPRGPIPDNRVECARPHRRALHVKPLGAMSHRQGGDHDALASRITTKLLPSWKEFPLGGFLGVLCVLAVNADLQFNRQVATDAKKHRSVRLDTGGS